MKLANHGNNRRVSPAVNRQADAVAFPLEETSEWASRERGGQ